MLWCESVHNQSDLKVNSGRLKGLVTVVEIRQNDPHSQAIRSEQNCFQWASLMTFKKQFRAITGLLLLTISSGCASLPGNKLADVRTSTSVSMDGVRAQSCGEDCTCTRCSQIEYGQPNTVVDAAGWIFGVPDKLLLWNSRVKNHNISQNTERTIRDYLQTQQLEDVKVRLNQYAPGDEWRRLMANREIGPGWKYTFGALSVAGYTILPGRVFGFDNYNPYTNTISLYSDVPSIAIHEGAYAKDNASREYNGTYGVLQQVPVVNMWHETIATRDALNYVDSEATELSQDAPKILHPLYGARLGSSVGGPVAGPLASVAGAVVGHATGRIQ